MKIFHKFIFCIILTSFIFLFPWSVKADPPLKTDDWIFRNYIRKEKAESLPGTQLLTWKQDYSVFMNAEIDRFLLLQTEIVRNQRHIQWNHHAKTMDDYERFIAPRREKLATILGAVDNRVDDVLLFFEDNQIEEKTGSSLVRNIRWTVFDDYAAEGILIEPVQGTPTRLIIAIPHCGMDPFVWFKSVPYLQQMANSGQVRIVIPTLVGRDPVRLLNRNVDYPAREALFQSAYEVGRHIIGYEIEMVRALLDHWRADPKFHNADIQVAGYGDGGMIALYTAALDVRVDSVYIAGYFDRREKMWKQPMDRNVFGLLNEFGDAELAAMIFPRKVFIESGYGVDETIAPQKHKFNRPELGDPNQKAVTLFQSVSAPALLESPRPEDVEEEIVRARQIVAPLTKDDNWIRLITTAEKKTWGSFTPIKGSTFQQNDAYLARQHRLFTQLDRHTQYILAGCWAQREKFMAKLDYRSLDSYKKSIQWYRDYFYTNVIGRFSLKPLPFNARSRKVFDETTWNGYDVVLDVFDHIYAQGLLLIPKQLKPGKRYPVVVYQHGLEGRPEGGLFRQSHNQILVRLVERGYIVFAPQDIYAGGDAFRTLQRKARPIGKTLYSITIPQHQQITDWLGTLPFVDKDKIGFYGISYGGKTAMRVPAVVNNYALSICCGDFGDWVYRVASSREPFSYIGTQEYEIAEFNLGGTFNHSEMAALIAPRPFMVERGHFDGCGRDEHVAFEYAKVRKLYAAKLGIGNRTEIEWFVGGHEINAVKTLDFLDRWLK